MKTPQTLLQLSGANLTPAKVRDASLVLIDLQNEYLSGPIAVVDAGSAIASAASLLALARQSGAPVLHVAHKGPAGGIFDRASERGQIVTELTPLASEMVIEKGAANAFVGTELQDLLVKARRKDVIVAGFMTHMCVSSTVRAAVDFGFRCTVASSACGTRDLPDGKGGVIAARTIHEVALAELSDRFAVIASRTEDLA
jgi:nicotinamidase-related amidase